MQLVTLTTDIGTNDFIIGAIKGKLISTLHQSTVVDISHQLSPYNFLQAAYICNGAFGHFPDGTVHIVLVQTFENGSNHLLLCNHRNQYVICPDNGIMTMITGHPSLEAFILPFSQADSMGILHIMQFVTAAIKELEKGRLPSEFCEIATSWVEKYPARFAAKQNMLECQIIFVDRFENVIVNITKSEFEQYRNNRPFKILLPSRTDSYVEKVAVNYSQVRQGEIVAWFNSAGYLELALKNGNIAGLFGLKSYAEPSTARNLDSRQLNYETICILFE
jgi:hypothetical protein